MSAPWIVSPQATDALAFAEAYTGLDPLRLGIELERPCGELLLKAAERGLLMSVTADTVVRLLPPLIISPAEVDELVGILVPLVREFLAAAPAQA